MANACISLNWLVKLRLSLDVWEERIFLSKFFSVLEVYKLYMYFVFSSSMIGNEIFLFHPYSNTFRHILERSDPMFFNVA